MTMVKMHLLRYVAARDSHKKQTWIAFLQRVSGRQRRLSDASCLLVCSVRVNQRPLEIIIRPPCGFQYFF